MSSKKIWIKFQKQTRTDSQFEELCFHVDWFFLCTIVNKLVLIFSRIFLIFFHRGFFTLYCLFWIILTLHLSIVWDITWVPVPSNTSPSFLWIVVTRASLFRYLLHINVAKKVVTVNLMRWLQLFLRYFCISLPFFHIHKTRPHLLSFLEDSSSCWDTNFRYASHIREGFPLQTFL